MLAPLPLFPVNAGDRVRIWQIAQGLARHFEVTLVAPYDGQAPTWGESVYVAASEHRSLHGQPIDHRLPHSCTTQSSSRLHLVPTATPAHTRVRQLQSLFGQQPYHVALRYHKQTHQTIEALLALNDYNLLYCHFLYTLPYVGKSTLPILLDQHNADRIYWQRKLDTQPRAWRQWVMRHNLKKTIAFEEQMAPTLDGIVSVSEQDRRFMQEHAAPTVPHFFVAPNGVDPEHYQINQADCSPRPRLTLGFLGSMELALNQAAVMTLLDDIYPAVRRQLPHRQVTVLVIGRQPPRWLVNWAQQHQDPNVTVTGDVADTLPYLHQVDLLVLPLQSGAGTKLRVLEAMAAGVCVLGTPLILDGLDKVIPGQHALIAHNSQALVEGICQLADNPTLRQQITRQARLVVEEHYSWQKITTQLAYEIDTVYGKKNATEETRAHLSTLLP